jgi:hypothetical protein
MASGLLAFRNPSCGFIRSPRSGTADRGRWTACVGIECGPQSAVRRLSCQHLGDTQLGLRILSPAGAAAGGRSMGS